MGAAMFRVAGPWSVKAGVLYGHAPASVREAVIALRVHLDDSTATKARCASCQQRTL